jgi:hypothetical protein
VSSTVSIRASQLRAFPTVYPSWSNWCSIIADVG